MNNRQSMGAGYGTGQAKNSSGPDLLSEVLSALSVDASTLYIFDFHEPWEIELDDIPVSISWTVLEGTVWIHVPGGERIALHRGDTFLLPCRGERKSNIIATNSEKRSGRMPARTQEVFRQVQLQGFRRGVRMTRPFYARWGGEGPMTRVVSADFSLSDRQLGPLLAALPEMIVVRATQRNDLVDILSRLALDEKTAQEPAFFALVTQIAQLLLVHIVRTYALSTGSALGWLAGLGDPQIARALACIHRQPGLHWSVATLARAAGLSRSEFAARFFAHVGQTAMQYLRAWRMRLAREALDRGDISVSALALELGYQSEAAFRAAFRQATGQSPREFRRRSS